jgi:hypothetical protein
MSRPVVHAWTERLYAQLPEVYRREDAARDWPLLRMFSLVGDRAGAALIDLVDSIDYVAADEGGPAGATSALADPHLARPEWLPWLAQVPGVAIDASMSVDEQRNAIATPASGWLAGTRPGIAAAARMALTGNRYVNVIPHFGGNHLVIGVATAPEETPSPEAVLAAIERAEAAPAGKKIEHTFYAPPWDLIEAEVDTWDGVEALGSWSRLESTMP